MEQKTNPLTANQLLTKEDLQEFQNILLKQLQEIIQNKKETKKWLRVSEVKELLRISASSIQTLRNNGTLTYAKIGGMYYYNYESIEKLIQEKCKVEEKKTNFLKCINNKK